MHIYPNKHKLGLYEKGKLTLLFQNMHLKITGIIFKNLFDFSNNDGPSVALL